MNVYIISIHQLFRKHFGNISDIYMYVCVRIKTLFLTGTSEKKTEKNVLRVFDYREHNN